MPAAPAVAAQPQLPAKASPTPPSAPTRLGKVQKGRLKRPFRYLFYGTHGIGKTTLAGAAQAPIFVDIEDGSAVLDVERYSFRDEPGGHVPTSYNEVLSAIDDLTVNPHAYQTLILDTADRLEALLWKFILQRDSKPGKPLLNLEDYGYNKGPGIALDEWRAFCLRLDRLRTVRQMDIIILGHAQVKNFKNPEGDDYDRYVLRINDKARGWLQEWADVAGFCCFEEFGAKSGEAARAKGFSTGRRLIKVARAAAFDAKSRYALPAEIEMAEDNPWAPFAAAVAESANLDPTALVALINAQVERIGDAALKPKVDAAVSAELKKGGTDALHRFLIGLQKRSQHQEA